MGRLVVTLGASVLLLGGFASSLLAAGTPGSGAATTRASTTGTTASTTTAATTTTSTTTVSASSALIFSGHGWGHGLGLSQWGAYGYAKHGWTFDQILAHYYAGTTLGPASVSTVRVLLVSAKKTTLSSDVSWTVTDATGAKTPLDPGALLLKPTLALAASPDLQPPFTFTSKQPITVDGHAYRGRFVVSSDGKSVSVINVVGLEQYVKGVVPAEMPSSWSSEALKAQAVAARSYALANRAKGRAYDLYGDTRSQAYGGVAVEAPSTSAAVDATKGQVVLYNGKVADTLFFSTSGGRTASALESTGLAVPYLVSVPDPYDTASPYHDWGPVVIDAAKAAKQFKLSAPIADLLAANSPSGRVKSFVVTSDDESQVTLTGNQVRSALELRSTWFSAALLRLLPATKTMTYGGAVSLTGEARGVDQVALEAKASGLDWAPVTDLSLDTNGAFTTVVKPQVSTQYRLVWGDVHAAVSKISVAPRVTVAATTLGAQGTIRPALAGAPVQLQQQTGTTWATLTATVTDAAGAWSFTDPLQTGTYRVRATPGHGLAAGVSATIIVP